VRKYNEYYINGRYYDPMLGRFLDADTPENLFSNANILGGLDGNGIFVDNMVNANVSRL